jgi:hypothetical protein
VFAVTVMFAEPLKLTPLMVRAVWSVVAVAALPDVELDVEALPFRAAVIVPALKLPEPSRSTIWLAVLALAAVIVALLAWLVMVAALPEIEIAYVPAARLFTVPLRVMLPLVVTVPDKLKPEAVPVPDTDVTVPVVELVPAPMAVRKDAASKEEMVLSALKRGKAIAATFASVKRFPPSVVAPRFVLAAAAVVAPVPPFATATVPVTFAAVPVVF